MNKIIISLIMFLVCFCLLLYLIYEEGVSKREFQIECIKAWGQILNDNCIKIWN